MAPSGPVPALDPRPERRATPPDAPVRVYGNRVSTQARAPEPRRWLFRLFVLALGTVCVVGWPYYSLPMAAQVRSPLHPWLKSSGYIGQSAGLLALAIFLFLWLYPLRKKFRWLAGVAFRVKEIVCTACHVDPHKGRFATGGSRTLGGGCLGKDSK